MIGAADMDHAPAPLDAEGASHASAKITPKTGHLTLAAACLADGREAEACDHLGRYLAENPDHRHARFLYAELLFRMKRPQEAHAHLERVVADQQRAVRIDWLGWLHCQQRLTALAEAADDEYRLHLERGIGLYVAAQLRSRLEEPGGDLAAESLLCRAAAELITAQALRDDEARPCYYLHQTWHQLGQQAAARRWLLEAIKRAPCSELTPAERDTLHMKEATFRAGSDRAQVISH